MKEVILYSLGGLGLFLIGMKVMTHSLNALAGDSLQSWLARVTKTPLRGVATGATVTAMIQSSSATTVAAVGFVGAGLLSFEQALGIVFGANIGTTITGWIVALIGIKVKLGVASLGIIFIGALLQLLGKGKWSDVGKAVGGFGLLFLGIDYLKKGLTSVAGQIQLDAFGEVPLMGVALFFVVGIVLSILTQSSSSTIATGLVALNTQVVDLPQAMAIIVGADVGTTATAYLATLGGSLASRRTGLSHVIYNLLTGVMALVLLYPYIWGWRWLSPGAIVGTPELVAVSFHTAFNALGVILIIPFAGVFARFVCRVIRDEKESPFDYELPVNSPEQTSTAVLMEVEQMTKELARQLLGVTKESLESRCPEARDLDKVQTYVVKIREALSSVKKEKYAERVLDQFHGVDHLERLLQRLRDDRVLELLRTDSVLQDEVQVMLGNIAEVQESEECDGETQQLDLEEGKDSSEGGFRSHWEDFEKEAHATRTRLIQESLGQGVSAADLDLRLDAYRWIKRVAYHLYRSEVYLRAW